MELRTYLVYQQDWEDKDIKYCGTDKQEAENILNEGDLNTYMETWEDGNYRYNEQGRYVRR